MESTGAFCFSAGRIPRCFWRLRMRRSCGFGRGRWLPLGLGCMAGRRIGRASAERLCLTGEGGRGRGRGCLGPRRKPSVWRRALSSLFFLRWASWGCFWWTTAKPSGSRRAVASRAGRSSPSYVGLFATWADLGRGQTAVVNGNSGRWDRSGRRGSRLGAASFVVLLR